MKVFTLIFAVCIASVCGRVIPDNLPQCKKDDPQLEKCILDAIEVIRPQLKNGIPEINIPALEPFVLPTLKLDRTAPNLRLKAVVKNVKALGGSNFKIEKLKINLNNKYAAEVKLFIPKLELVGEYDVQGSRILTVDVNGKGKVKSNITGITVVAKGLAKTIKKDGVEYLQADKVITQLKIADGKVVLDDSERQAAATSAATFFNASPGTVLEILNPLIEETAAAVLKAFLNKILGAIPLREILNEES